MHLLLGLRSASAEGRLSELRRRTGAAAAATGGEAFEISGIDAASLQTSGLRRDLKDSLQLAVVAPFYLFIASTLFVLRPATRGGLASLAAQLRGLSHALRAEHA